jgi:hypothetical protein
VSELVRWDLVDEAVIEGTPQEGWDALMAAERGEIDWWEPHLRMRPRGPQRGEVGDAFEVRVSGDGRLDRWDAVHHQVMQVGFEQLGAHLRTHRVGGTV